VPFPRESTLFRGEGALLLRELRPYFLNLLTIIVIPFLFLYMLVTYHWKGLKENDNFVVGSISTKTHMEKI
jgi:hypothetical protein